MNITADLGENITVLVEGGTVAGDYGGTDGNVTRIGPWRVTHYCITGWAYTRELEGEA